MLLHFPSLFTHHTQSSLERIFKLLIFNCLCEAQFCRIGFRLRFLEPHYGIPKATKESPKWAFLVSTLKAFRKHRIVSFTVSRRRRNLLLKIKFPRIKRNASGASSNGKWMEIRDHECAAPLSKLIQMERRSSKQAPAQHDFGRMEENWQRKWIFLSCRRSHARFAASTRKVCLITIDFLNFPPSPPPRR